MIRKIEPINPGWRPELELGRREKKESPKKHLPKTEKEPESTASKKKTKHDPKSREDALKLKQQEDECLARIRQRLAGL